MKTTQKVALIFAVSMGVTATNALAVGYWQCGGGGDVVDGAGNCVRSADNDGRCGDAAPVKRVVKKRAVAAPKPVPKPQRTSRTISLSSETSFATGGSTLSAGGRNAVSELAGKLEGGDIKKIIVSGHTDDRGSAAFNQSLSEKRANAVRAELIRNGVNAGLIQTVGHGESRPIATNSTAAGRAQNRRVEIQVDGTITVDEDF